MKLKKRFEKYENSLSDIFALQQMLDFILCVQDSINKSYQDNSIKISEELCVILPSDLEFHDNLNRINSGFRAIVEHMILIEEAQDISRVHVVGFPNIDFLSSSNEHPIITYLQEIFAYLKVFIEIKNCRIQKIIPLPQIENIDFLFFYSYLIYKNCILKGTYTRDEMEEVLKIAGSNTKIAIRFIDPQAAVEGVTHMHPAVDIIIALLAAANPKFYITDEILNNILDVIHSYDGREYDRYVLSSVSRARGEYLNNNSYRHPIYELSTLIQKGIRPLPNFLSNTTNIDSWPSIELELPNLKKTISLPISRVMLAKFCIHLEGSIHLRFYISIPGLNVFENERFYSSLIAYMSKIIDSNGKVLNLLGSEGSIRLPPLLQYKPHLTNSKKPEPNIFIKYITDFIDEYIKQNHPSIPFKANLFESDLLLILQNFAEQYGLMSYGEDGETGLALFDHIKILELLYQTLSTKPVDLDYKEFPSEFNSILWDSEIDKVLEILKYTLRVALRVKDISSEENFEHSLFSVSQVLYNKISRGESLILQLGYPKIGDSSGHSFYVVIKAEQNNANIIIVDGENRDGHLDPAYDPIDVGKGSRILCRETGTFETSLQSDFLTHYLYRALKLRYEKAGNKAIAKELIENIQLKSKIFFGKDNQTIDNIPQVDLSHCHKSIASQNFEDCTMSNLREALRIYFDWNPSQMAQFIGSASLRFNFLLYQNNHLIEDTTLKAQEMLKQESMREYVRASELFLVTHYNGQGHSIVTVPADGNCFYHSIEYLLKKLYPHTMSNFIDGDAIHIQLRDLVVTYLRENPQLLTNEGIYDVDSYLDRISNHGDGDRDGEWADTIQIHAMLAVLRSMSIPLDNIVIHTDNNQIQLADVRNFNTENIIHLYYHRNHFMPIIENLENPIVLRIDEGAIQEPVEFDDISDIQQTEEESIYNLEEDSSLDQYFLDSESEEEAEEVSNQLSSDPDYLILGIIGIMLMTQSDSSS